MNDIADCARQCAALREHFDNEMASMRREVNQRFDAGDKAISAALLAAEKATTAALDAAQRAVTKAEGAVDKRLEGMNEFRGALQDLTSTLMPRAECENRLSTMAKDLGAISSRIDRGEGRGAGLNAGWGYIVGGALLLIAIITLLLKFAGN